ncbi:EI24 domain-containing protein [Roseobacter sinensis]|uniref:EI24 domain-containing protein n=1 Tax=Roseobacter sinensis TaxID=2931391 RepID=A0ABT3BCW8_9RHOB|nr:EI24 domain-containing protein [Roseobacter sp. WL0113]MCV3271411.1 EI24 domain-containing protein [Roseobacter sp. WL0113]
MILTAFFSALGQMTDRRFRRVLLLGLALTLALLIAASAAFVWLISGLVGETTTIWFIGEVSWLQDLVSWGSALLLAVLSSFLMIPVASAITSMFLETVAQAVEDEHYPHLPPATSVPFGDALRDTVNFLGVLIAANLAALILYLIFAPAALFIFWGLNGFLLGREYFTLAALRRVGRKEAKVLRSRHMLTIWAAGTLMAIPLTIPLLNLIIPILGAATFTHLFHLLAPQGSHGQTSQDRAR